MVSALHGCGGLGGPLLACGFEGGGASLLDMRCGGLAAAWPAHAERVTALAADGHRLVTSSQVGFAAGWATCCSSHADSLQTDLQ